MESHLSSSGIFISPRAHYSGTAPRDSDENDNTRGGKHYWGYGDALVLEKSKHWFDLQLWWGHRHKCMKDQNWWMLASTLLTEDKDKCSHSEFITLTEKAGVTLITRSYQYGETRGTKEKAKSFSQPSNF